MSVKRLTLAASLVAVVSSFAQPSPALAGSTIKITKIHYAQTTNLNSEYIVFKNMSGARIQMKGWKIISAPSTDHQYYVFPRTRVPAGATVTLYSGFGSNSPGKRYWGSTSPNWNNDGDKAVLKNASGAIVDTCQYAGGGTTAYC